MLPFITEHASCRCRAMLLDTETYAFGHGNLCFRTRGAMLLDMESYAFEVGNLCFWGRKAMLLRSGSYAFHIWELCFSLLRVILGRLQGYPHMACDVVFHGCRFGVFGLVLSLSHRIL